MNKKCRKGEIGFKGHCYKKSHCEPKYKLIDWKDLSDDKPSGCWVDGAHVVGKCIVPVVKKAKEKDKYFNLPKIIKKVMHKRHTEKIKLPEIFKDVTKMGNMLVDTGLFYRVLSEATGEKYSTKKGDRPPKKMIGEKVSVTFWNDKQPDMPLIIPGKDVIYVIAPRIEQYQEGK